MSVQPEEVPMPDEPDPQGRLSSEEFLRLLHSPLATTVETEAAYLLRRECQMARAGEENATGFCACLREENEKLREAVERLRLENESLRRENINGVIP